MRNSEPLVLSMPQGIFLAWLRSGICWLPPVAFTLAADDVHVQLPSKYSDVLKLEQPVIALIDEVVAISQATPEMTKELAIWLRNLGESWLSVQYMAVHQETSPVTQVAQHEPASQVDDSAPSVAYTPEASLLVIAESAAREDAITAPSPQQPAAKKKRTQGNGATTRSKKANSSAVPHSNTAQSALFNRSDSSEAAVKE